MRDKLDGLIRDIILEDIEKVRPPSPSEEWQAFSRRYLAPQKKAVMAVKPKTLLTACASLLALLVLFYVYQAPVMAVAKNVIQSISSVFGDTLHLRKSVSPEATGGEGAAFRFDDPRIGEAQKKVHFTLRVPEYVPEGYELKRVDISGTYPAQEAVALYFEENKPENVAHFIKITQTYFTEQSDMDYSIKNDSSDAVSKVKVNRQEGTFVAQRKNHYKLLWDLGEVSYIIDSNIDQKEMIKMAESMK